MAAQSLARGLGRKRRDLAIAHRLDLKRARTGKVACAAREVTSRSQLRGGLAEKKTRESLPSLMSVTSTPDPAGDGV